MRIVLDTSVVVAALRSEAGASSEILRLALQGRLKLIGTLSLALEYLDVCGRPEIRAGLAITEAEALKFADQVVALLHPTEVRFRWRPLGPDPGDDHVVEAALNGGAEAIVTFNGRDFAKASQAFGLRILRPADSLRDLEHSNG